MKWPYFVGYCSLFFLALIPGCCVVVAKSGDAKILRCPQLIHEQGTKYYQMELPKVSIARDGTRVLQVRHLPTYLKGLFKYDLSMIVPTEDGEGTNTPWNGARISIAFQKLDGTEVFKRAFLLGTTPHGFGPHRSDSQVDWNLGAGPHGWDPVPVTDDSFDIVVTVEQPSRRVSDQICISAFAIFPPLPK